LFLNTILLTHHLPIDEWISSPSCCLLSSFFFSSPPPSSLCLSTRPLPTLPSHSSVLLRLPSHRVSDLIAVLVPRCVCWMLMTNPCPTSHQNLFTESVEVEVDHSRILDSKHRVTQVITDAERILIIASVPGDNLVHSTFINPNSRHLDPSRRPLPPPSLSCSLC
jgi:hypothetical protein